MKYPKVPRVDLPQYQSAEITGLLVGVRRSRVALALIRLAGRISGAKVVIRKPRRKSWPRMPAKAMEAPRVP